jgi:hypothetical protein
MKRYIRPSYTEHNILIIAKSSKEMIKVIDHISNNTKILHGKVFLSLPKGYGMDCNGFEHCIRLPTVTESLRLGEFDCF